MLGDEKSAYEDEWRRTTYDTMFHQKLLADKYHSLIFVMTENDPQSKSRSLEN